MQRTREVIHGADDRVTESIKAGRADLEAAVRAWCDWKG